MAYSISEQFERIIMTATLGALLIGVPLAELAFLVQSLNV